MPAFEHILVPMDLSVGSDRMIAPARRLAAACGARLTFVHVAPPSVGDGTRQALAARLRALADAPRPVTWPTRCEMLVGEPSTEILGFAGGHGVDLILLPPPRRDRLGHLLADVASTRIAREAAGSVLLLGSVSGQPGPLPSPATRVLCAVDFTSGSADTLRVAADLARAAHARLTVLHVIDRWKSPIPVGPESADAVRDGLAAAAYDRLTMLIADVSAADLEPEALVSFGAAADAIVDAGLSIESDLLVLGPHPYRPLGHPRLGSTVPGVLSRAQAAVLLARPYGRNAGRADTSRALTGVSS